MKPINKYLFLSLLCMFSFTTLSLMSNVKTVEETIEEIIEKSGINFAEIDELETNVESAEELEIQKDYEDESTYTNKFILESQLVCVAA